MSEPFLERLSRLTPDAGRLDRDALLFAAGRTSARPNRGWIALASTLAVTQAVSLTALFLPPPLLGTGGVGREAVATSYPPPSPSPARGEGIRREEETLPGKGSAAWLAHHRLPDLDSNDSAAPSGTLVESEPPLRALARPESVLN